VIFEINFKQRMHENKKGVHLYKKNDMGCTANFYLLNDHFSEEHADANHNGEESEMNLRYEWEDELEVKGKIQSVDVKDFDSYFIQGSYSNEESFSIEVKSMRTFSLNDSEGGTAILAVSESIIDSYELIEQDGEWSVKVFIKDYEPLSNPIPGIYIASQDFPKELIEA